MRATQKIVLKGTNINMPLRTRKKLTDKLLKLNNLVFHISFVFFKHFSQHRDYFISHHFDLHARKLRRRNPN